MQRMVRIHLYKSRVQMQGLKLRQVASGDIEDGTESDEKLQ